MITIADDVFSYDEEESLSYETFVVTGSFDPAVVVSALADEGERRLMSVGEDGVEYADETALQAAVTAGVYTPNYMSDPEVTDRGVEVYLDCKGAIEDPMALTLRRVLREVLEAVVDDAVVEAVVIDE